MECNRDEALRAKAIAEARLEDKDFIGAKKFALKAQALYPELDGISQMLTALEVYVAGEIKIRGEVDWYAVLCVNPTADDEMVRKQYKKLALMLHPDKNNSVGADGAFQLISEAWSLLSDKAKRSAYNQRRSCNGYLLHLQVPASGAASTQTNEPEVVHTNFRNNRTSSVPKTNRTTCVPKKTTSVPKPCSTGMKVPQKSAPPPSFTARTDTFWTTCHGCETHYEYVMMYVNCTLLCPTCKNPYFASDTGPPPMMKKRRA